MSPQQATPIVNCYHVFVSHHATYNLTLYMNLLYFGCQWQSMFI